MITRFQKGSGIAHVATGSRLAAEFTKFKLNTQTRHDVMVTLFIYLFNF